MGISSKNFVVGLVAATVSLSAFGAYKQGDYTMDKRRGSPAEYDPGPAKGSEWAKLFGSTPNYRAIGAQILKDGATQEKFRWQFGPMWYRGRLGANEVQVFVVGQEGAQDENISNRSFTGSTGTKTQHFLNHLGIYKSYLFLNTFVYTINGQLEDDPNFKWLEQDTASPVVQYRHSLFDNMLLTNKDSLALLMGVGSGGKASLATWVNARGGDCSAANNLANCDTSGMRAYFKVNHGIDIKKDILVIGVPHPGGASPANGGLNALKSIVAGFTKAAQNVAAKMKSSQEKGVEWLVPDKGDAADNMERMSGEFEYGDSPVPFRDFTFGTNWRMGEEGTTSNRRGADTIQVFSDKGAYNNDGHTLKYIGPRDIDSGWEMASGKVVRLLGMSKGDVKTDDVPYESPRWNPLDAKHVDQYDNGPCGADASGKPLITCELATLLQTWPDFWSGSVKPIADPSFGHGPVYRGRLTDAQILVLADQAEHDDFFTTRALTGSSGQRLQNWLSYTGAGSSYGILRTLPVDTLGMPTEDVIQLALRPDIAETRAKIIAKVLSFGKTKAFVAVGPVAAAVAKTLALPAGVTLIELPAATSDEHIVPWNRGASAALEAIGGGAMVGFYDGKLMTIARMDLPSHTRWWMGSSGTRASRGEKKVNGEFVTNGDYYKVWAPKWVTQLRPKPLDQEMREYLDGQLDDRGRSGSRDLSLYFADLGDPSAEEGNFEFYGKLLKNKTLGQIEELLAAELRARGLEKLEDLMEFLAAKGRTPGEVVIEEDTRY